MLTKKKKGWFQACLAWTTYNTSYIVYICYQAKPTNWACVHCYSCIIPNTQIVHNMSWRIQVHFTQPGFALAEISREIAANREWRRHWPLRGPGGRDSRRGDQCRTNLTKRLISAWQDRRVVFSDTWNSRVRYLQYLDQRYLVGKGRGKVFRAFWIIDHKQIF